MTAPFNSPTWPYVVAFALRMEQKLDQNRHKGDREGWINDSAVALLKRLREETEELALALDGDLSRKLRAPDEAADVANFAMMIADICGGVTPDPIFKKPSIEGLDSYRARGERLGDLVDQKQRAYGDSFGKAGEVLRILYPNGVKPEHFDDLLTVARVLDKLFRVATNRDALGESPWGDVAGYGLLAQARADRAKGGAR